MQAYNLEMPLAHSYALGAYFFVKHSIMNIKINPEFEALIPPLSKEEFAQLEQNILDQGIIDPLVVWEKLVEVGEKTKNYKCYSDGVRYKNCDVRLDMDLWSCDYCGHNVAEAEYEYILLDGHNRYRIAQKHDVKFEVHVIDDSCSWDKSDAMEWMDKNQLGRRNLSPDMMSFIRGRMYERTKGKQGGDKKSKDQNDTLINAADKIAKQTGVSSPTIKRDAQYFQAVEAVAKQMDIPAVQLVHKNLTTKKDAPKLRQIAEQQPEILQSIQSQITADEAPTKNLARELIHTFERKEVQELQMPKICAYDSNMFYQSAERSEERYGDKVFSLDDEKYNTVSTLSRFFHRETGNEFTLREYANVQTFPCDYKFVGNYSSIKKQIGNAVAPYMGKYMTAQLKGKTIGDLFAGCGGFSCGAHSNGLKTLWAVEWDELASLSYKINFPDTKVFNTDIKALEPSLFAKVDIIIGGPPCQGFSSANHENKKVAAKDRFQDDPRNSLYKEFLRFVDCLKPNEFVMENVPEIQDVKDEIIADFEAIGYDVKTQLVIGNEIGMKQNRKRFFFIGSKK